MLAGANGRFLVLGLLWVWPIPEALEAPRSYRLQPTQLSPLSTLNPEAQESIVQHQPEGYVKK